MLLPPSRGRRGTADVKCNLPFTLSRYLRSSTGYIQRRDGGQRRLSDRTDGSCCWSNGTWTTCTCRRSRYGSRGSFGEDGTVPGCTEPHVPVPDARAWVPGEIWLHLRSGRVSQSARTKPLPAALSPAASSNRQSMWPAPSRHRWPLWKRSIRVKVFKCDFAVQPEFVVWICSPSRPRPAKLVMVW